eukprot:Nitzschia sp. Nitz4//scaffold16_size188269//56136//57251//NITZ4_001786-RA/size188269-processed-gene-0.10-mRNA-1//1//CDS//3329538502//7065//frame0
MIRSLQTSTIRLARASRRSTGAASLSTASPLASTTTSTTSNTAWEDVRGSSWANHPWVGAMAAMAVTMAWAANQQNQQPTFCERSVVDEEDAEEEEVDPYDNLPEEDEPTHCSICLTYRQGPCRPYWRKVEACTKDNELPKKDEEESEGEEGEPQDQPDPPCFKYMLPWIDCASGYRNLYNLIEMDTNYTMGILDLEQDATSTACWAPSAEPKVNWAPWQVFVHESKDPVWTPPDESKDVPKKQSLWKTLGTDKDPMVVEVLAKVPALSPTQGGGVLECAYAVDQTGHVLGFAYGTKPSDVVSKGLETATAEAEEMVDLKIRLLPTHTRSITIAAAYTQPKTPTKKGDADSESHIFKTRPMDLEQVAKVDA